MEEQNDGWTCECENVNSQDSQRCLKCKRPKTDTKDAQCSMIKATVFTEQTKGEYQQRLIEDQTRRILLVGIPGSGKSSFGNNILGDKTAFKADCSATAVTIEVMCGVGEWEGREVVVFDTPGIDLIAVDKRSNRLKMLLDIMGNCLWSLGPGFHVVAFIVSVGRVSSDTLYLLEILKKVFGNECTQFILVVFTRIDDLGKKTLKQHVDGADDKLRKLAHDSGYLGINNKANGYEMRNQIDNFFLKVDEKIKRNNGKFYTNKHFKEAYALLQKEAKRLGVEEVEVRKMNPPSAISKIMNLMYEDMNKAFRVITDKCIIL